MSLYKNSPTKISTKMNNENILILGPEMSGRSKLINLICGSVKLTQTKAISIVAENNSSISKPIEFGILNLQSGENIHLIKVDNIFQMSSLKRYWLNKFLGCILLVDLSSKDPLSEMQQTISDFAVYLDNTSLSIGLVNANQHSLKKVSYINQKLAELDLKIPVFEIESSSYVDVSLLLQSMLISNLHGITQSISSR